MCILTNMSESGERTLRSGLSEGEAKHLLQSLKVIVWRGDPDSYRFTYVSPAAETIMGYPVQRWIDEPTFWTDKMHPEDRDWALTYCLKSTEALTDHEFEYRMLAADGRTVWLKDIVHLIVEDGHPVESVGVMVDITDRKRAEEAERRLAAAHASQRSALKVNDDIVQGLAAAKYALELDAEDMIAETITTTLERARKIVSDLLDQAEAAGIERSELLERDSN